MVKIVEGAEPNKLSAALSLKSFFWRKEGYKEAESKFHAIHRHDFDVFINFLTAVLGLWSVVELAFLFDRIEFIYAYGALIILACPHFMTIIVHTVMLGLMIKFPLTSSVPYLFTFFQVPSSKCLMTLAFCHGAQSMVHWACYGELIWDHYDESSSFQLLADTIWFPPLMIDSMSLRYWFAPMLFINKNRNIFCDVCDANKKSIEFFRSWIKKNVEETAVTTHIWPHDNGKELSEATVTIENDASIFANFRKVFASKHYDILPVQGMNEIYVTAVGAKSEINSDAVFYTKHTDGPYWFLPCASLYRVLVGATPNSMVRTNFNLQHESQNRVVDLYGVLGFDYSRELHYIDHVEGAVNKERRALIKLHYIVYPKGWHQYGQFCATLQTNYNTWARNNFLQTLKVESTYDWLLAWWIWLVTIINGTFEENCGWPNVVYYLSVFALSGFSLSSNTFLVLTSFRHYFVYMTTFAFREIPVAHGFFVRDVLLFKTVAIIQLLVRLLPLIDFTDMKDLLTVFLAMAGYGITMMATARLGFVRTYFGSELGLVKPKWIVGFPYGYIPHPMIVGQLIAYGSILGSPWFFAKMPFETKCLLAGHMSFYSVHMLQEMLTSSY